MTNPTLNYQSEGEGEPLIILHGLFGSSRNWSSHAKKLAVDFKVIRVDLRNHGESFHDQQMDYAAMADDLVNLMDELGIASAHFLGHSMGGKVAMMLCHKFPQRVKKLIVADMAPVRYRHDHDNLIKPVLAMDLALVKSRNIADEMLASSIDNKQIRLFLLQNLDIVNGQACWKINWQVLDENMQKLTGYPPVDDWNVPHQSLFIRGENSDYVKPEHWQVVQQHFQNARLVSLKNAGHWLHFEQPEPFYQSVVAFLKSN